MTYNTIENLIVVSGFTVAGVGLICCITSGLIIHGGDKEMSKFEKISGGSGMVGLFLVLITLMIRMWFDVH